jgi:ankyrin repeat protein
MSVSRDGFSDQVSFRFRWVFCQLETLRRSVHRNLRGILAKLPKTLDETYERVLRDINEDNREHARRLLHCLAFAIRPLRVEELAEILAFDFDDIQGDIPKFRADWRSKDQEGAVLSTCSSLISVVDSDLDYFGKCRVVQFSHFSVKEFLVSDRLASVARDTSRYHILPGPAHTILAQACLGFLLHLDSPTDEETGKRFPLARYAAQHWVAHAQFEDVASHVKDGMRSLFDPDERHLAAWDGIYHFERYSHFTPNPLYYAALCGLYDIVEHLVVSHPQLINTLGGYYDFPLLAALSENHIRVAEFLIRNGAKVDILGAFGRTPLQRLLSFKQPSEVRVSLGSFLLKHGADVNFRASDLSTPLHHAIISPDVKVVQFLLESGADVHSRDDKGRTPLHLVNMAYIYDDELEGQAREIIRLVLEGGANMNAQDKNGDTPLLLAHPRLNGARVARILLMNGAEPNVKNNDGETALHRSLTCYCSPDADSFNSNHDIRNRVYDVARILLEHGANPNVTNSDGKTSLHLVFQPKVRFLEDTEVLTGRLVCLLLEHGADVNAQDKDKRIPLLLAIQQMMYDVTRILLARSAEPNVKDDGGKTPLHLLFEGDFSSKDDIPDLIRLLLDRGADVNVQDQKHATPLLLAVKRRKYDIARTLLEHGADPNVKNIRGETPLHLLLERKFYDYDDVNDVMVIERLLLERGADVNAQDKYKTTPLHLASNHHIPEIAQIILNRANAETDSRTAQLHVTLEGESNFRSSFAVFHSFTRACHTHDHPEHGPHNPPTFGMLLWETRGGKGGTLPGCSIKR